MFFLFIMEIFNQSAGGKTKIWSTTYKGQSTYNQNSWAEMTFFTTDVSVEKECLAVLSCSICFSNGASGLNAAFRFVKFVNDEWETIKTGDNYQKRLGVNFSEQPKPDADQHLTTVSYSICDILEPGTKKVSLQMRATDTDQIYFNRPKRYDSKDFLHNASSTFTVFLLEGDVTKNTSSDGSTTYESFVTN